MPELPGFITASHPPDAIELCGVVDIAAAKEEGGRPTFSIAAYNGGPMSLAAFYSPVVIDLAGLRVNEGGIPVLRGHSHIQVVGQSTSVDIGESSISVDGVITDDGPDGSFIVGNAKNGFRWQASVGVNIDRREFIEAGKDVEVNGQSLSGPLNIVRAGELYEVSFVAVGADRTSSAKVRANHNGPAKGQKEIAMKFAEWLTANGFDPDGISEKQKATLQAAFDASQQPKGGGVAAPTIDPDAAVQKLRASMGAEAERVGEIHRIVAQYGVTSAKLEDGTEVANLAAHAISAGMDPRDVELYALRAARPNKTPDNIHRPQFGSAEVVEAALCLAGTLNNVEASFKPETLEAAQKEYKERIGLQQLFLQAAYAGGYSGPARITSGNFREVLNAAFSTLSLPGILSNTANKFLMDGFNAQEQSWRQIADIGSVSDFKAISRYRLTADLEFKKVGKDGELQHGTLGEDTFTNKADTYGRMLAITREDIINDDLGALTTEPRKRFGTGAAKALNRVFWAVFNDHASFFTAGNGNLITGATTTLTATGLAEAYEAFMALESSDGDLIGTTPKILLVPPALAVAAQELFASTMYTGGSSKTLSANIWAGQYEPVVSRYLSTSTEWYLLADPAELAAIGVVFLNGIQAPTIETGAVDFNQLGVQMRGYLDFGVALQDPMAGIKSKGAA